MNQPCTILKALLRYAHEQGVCHRLPASGDLTLAQVPSRFRV